jgi:hypothetical protein
MFARHMNFSLQKLNVRNVHLPYNIIARFMCFNSRVLCHVTSNLHERQIYIYVFPQRQFSKYNTRT